MNTQADYSLWLGQEESRQPFPSHYQQIIYPSAFAVTFDTIMEEPPIPLPFTNPPSLLPINSITQQNYADNANDHSMAPPPQRKRVKAPTMREENWKPLDPRITQLYEYEQQTVSLIQETIEKEFGIKLT
jgi:hypothetical protein